MDLMDIFRANMARMSQTEVFRPSTGPLLVRGNLSDGLPTNMDVFKKDRPSTQGGSRFGRMSHNSFFARHNPHPAKVRHIKGLLDVPICAVNDGGYFANPRYSMQFPPSAHDNNKLKSYSGYLEKLPASSINVNSQMHPIDTISGLQYFMGKPLNFRVFREKAVPRVGMVPVSEGWRDELKALTEAVGVSVTNLPKIDDPKQKKPTTADSRPRTEGGRPRTSQYSANTGRLIPPPSRAMSRGASRQGNRTPYLGLGQLDHLSEEPDMENMILQMLCQILQTDNIHAVQSWLVSAGDREKALALDMIKSVIANKDDYYQRGVGKDGVEQDRANSALEGQILGARSNDLTKRIDRLSLDGDGPRSTSQMGDHYVPFSHPMNETDAALDGKVGLQKLVTVQEDGEENDYNKDVFRISKSQCGDRPRSTYGPAKVLSKPSSPAVSVGEPRLRYTMTDANDQGTGLQ